jgi:hypothetical protein
LVGLGHRRIGARRLPAVAPQILVQGAQSGDSELGPQILEPSRPTGNEIVAVVGEIEIHKSHVYDRMLETNRRGASTYVDMLVSDAVIAQQARHRGIEVDAKAIDALVEQEEQSLRGQVEVEWAERLTFEEYLRRQFDMDVEQYRRFLRIELARQRYRSLVIRFLAMLEDRVEVRFIANRDRELLEEVRAKVLDGADFATLATRHSEDETFSRAFQHPIAKVAFELEPGELSDIFAFETNGVNRFCLVYSLRKMPGRDVEFAEVRGELIGELASRPLTRFEQQAFTLRWCRPTEPVDPNSLNTDPNGR